MHLRTPLLRSTPLTARAGQEVWLKMESSQPSGSFKLRGIGRACARAVEGGAKALYSSSGGNAGLAVAWAGRTLGVPTTVVVPQTTNARIQGLLRAEGATVLVHGAVWDEAHQEASRRCAADGGAYLHPFDDPDLWDGHSTLIHEVAEAGLRPGSVVCAVGGGGLLCGLAQGLQAVGWTDTPIIAVETHGAASFAGAVAAGEPITLDRIDTIALTMGAKRVCDAAFAWTQRHPITPVRVSDADAVDACLRFADDHRVLVEPSCGAALSLAYDAHPALADCSPVLIVVCGGSGVTRADLDQWSTTPHPAG